jgi:hypothetical protein
MSFFASNIRLAVQGKNVALSGSDSMDIPSSFKFVYRGEYEICQASFPMVPASYVKF